MIKKIGLRNMDPGNKLDHRELRKSFGEGFKKLKES